MGRWLLYAFAILMIGMTVYELISGKIISRRIFYTLVREEQPRAYWFGFVVDLALTIWVCYLAYDLAFPSHSGN